MKKVTFFLIILSFSFYRTSAQKKITGKIVDKETGEEVPFAHIYIKDHLGTVSNQDGEFIVSLNTVPQILVISHITYEAKEVIISAETTELLNIPLKTKATLLKEVSISPYNTQEIVTDAIKKGLKGLKYKTKAEMFYRQITKTNDEPTEVIEAFYNGVTSVAGLENVKLVNGRFANKQSDENNLYPRFGNFNYLSTVPVVQEEIRDVIFPLNANFDTYYDYKIKRIIDSDEGFDIAVINFKAKSVEKAILEGDVYIDLQTKNIVKVKGQIKNNMGIKFESADIHAENTVFSIDILFDHLNSNIPALQSVKVDISFDMVQGEVIKQAYITSMMFAYAQNGAANKNTKRMTNKSDLLKEIRKTRYKKKYWEDNPIIKRTLAEQSIIKSFEESSLFKYQSK